MFNNYKIFSLTLFSALSVASSAFAAAHYLPDYEDTWGGFASSTIPIHSQIQNAEDNCNKAGYTITSCPEGFAADIKDLCPYSIDKKYYKKCYSLAEICMQKGFSSYCGDGYEFNESQYCSYDSAYKKCKCAECEGFDYTEAQANALGYEPDGEPCNSCGVYKYKRKDAACSGFDYDSSSCGVSSCGTLSGLTCQAGNVLKYKECTPCPVPGCDTGMINMDTYWCDGALRCWWPAPSESTCTQTACFDFPYSESVTCQSGMTKESCSDACVGTRYKCVAATGCDGYDLTSKTGCSYGYDECADTSGMKHYKCKACSATNTCTGYTLIQQSGCSNGYQSCDDGCGNIKYKCKPYAVGDTYYSGGMLVGKVIEISGNNLIVASPIKSSSAEIADFCDTMSPGNWYVPDHKYGAKIFSTYRSSMTAPSWSYLRIKIGSNFSSDYCIKESSTWSKSSCTSSSYTLYNSCLTAVQ